MLDWRAMLARYRNETDPASLERMAAELGLTAGSLRRLGIAWAGPHRAWAFPMYDENLRVIGIRLRGQDGRKWAVGGSRSGLFIPDAGTGGKFSDGPVLVCEGPTDTATMLDLGFPTIGRPSCIGCEEIVAQLCRRRDVVIVADRDEPKTAPDGRVFRPGQDGAQRLAAELFGKVRSIRIIYPLSGKDARAWLRAGATRAVVLACIGQAFYWRPG